MNTEKLQALLTVLEQGSLTAAAERLHFTTSGVSRAIAALEEELQVDLLYRGKDGVRPTPECERLLPEIRELLLPMSAATLADGTYDFGQLLEGNLGNFVRREFA